MQPESNDTRISDGRPPDAFDRDATDRKEKMEVVGRFAGGLAHDFNNLLAGIMGSLELIEVRLSQARFREIEQYVEAARAAAKRAAALTHRLLTFARRQTLDPKSTDMHGLVIDLEESIRQTMGPAISVQIVGGANLWNCLVDPVQLQEALLNLCTNARDAMPDSGLLTIGTANRSIDPTSALAYDLAAGDYVALSVADSGTGMSPRVIERAFDPFFTTKPAGEGTGLGLSMVYGLARQSGGNAHIDSSLGTGTTVYVFFPRHLSESTSFAGPRWEATGEPPKNERTLLIVDDEPTVRLLVAEQIRELGYTALEATDGAAALSVLRSNARVNLLVTDVGLPGGLDGRQLADAARRLRPDLPVLFITGYAENAVMRGTTLDAGMRVLTKPFAMDRLASGIRELGV
ncbi:MAG: hybrid sensor histidine kinase/response regulator [Gammaproteobacteria bacterium]|nr:hybrid sensor histidine kinase/response regulator [Gammaproteobacteria bacterium]